MKVEIWSDVVCPFCYLGKKKFENALAQFEYKDQVEVIWHSFQLDPNSHYQPGVTITDYLVEHKGYGVEDVKEMNSELKDRGAAVGLTFNFEKALPANTFDAHRVIHLAGINQLQNEAEERLFKAYFTEGQNIEDKETLAKIANEIGLSTNDVADLLAGDRFTDEVKRDIHDSKSLGIKGVPFFLIDEKFSVSGAQESNYFLRALTKAWVEEV
ncbi:MAG: DsbA family oxidoreductase [Bacteroidetes bacterium]|nr:DsbA family oxidoreductase [Bacteroidota bacterium]